MKEVKETTKFQQKLYERVLDQRDDIIIQKDDIIKYREKTIKQIEEQLEKFKQLNFFQRMFFNPIKNNWEIFMKYGYFNNDKKKQS